MAPRTVLRPRSEDRSRLEHLLRLLALITGLVVLVEQLFALDRARAPEDAAPEPAAELSVLAESDANSADNTAASHAEVASDTPAQTHDMKDTLAPAVDNMSKSTTAVDCVAHGASGLSASSMTTLPISSLYILYTASTDL